MRLRGVIVLFTGGCYAFEPRGGSHHHNYGRTPFYSFEWPSLQPPDPHQTAAGASIQTRRPGAFGKKIQGDGEQLREAVVLDWNSPRRASQRMSRVMIR